MSCQDASYTAQNDVIGDLVNPISGDADVTRLPENTQDDILRAALSV
jgi:hypothetical protein